MGKTMTTKELAATLGKPDRTVYDWVKSLSAKSALVSAKIAVSSPSNPACWTVAEACEIIAEGMGEAAAGVYKINAAQAELDRQKAEADKVTSRKVLPKLNSSLIKSMRSLYGDSGAATRIDALYGFKDMPFKPAPLLITSNKRGPRFSKAFASYEKGIAGLDALEYPITIEDLASFFKVNRSTVWRQSTEIGIPTRTGRFDREEAGKLWRFRCYGDNVPE